MSEFSSFYLQVNIKKEDLQKVLSEKTRNIEDYSDWKEWFSAKQRIYGDPAKFLENYGYRFADTINNEIKLQTEHAVYHQEKQLLILDNINIGESFEVFMQYLIVFRIFGEYAIPKSENNFMVIYPYWWGDREKVNEFADAYIEFNDQKSFLKDDLKQQNMEIATNYFNEHAEEFAQEFYDKYGSF
ncbi:MAG: hypothetical protein ACK5JF_00915 [Oscillospiraceae bacterium]